MRILPFVLILTSAAVCAEPGAIPLIPKSVRFAVIGDNGTGARPQYEVAEQMEKYRLTTGFDFVLMNGDDIYGGKRPSEVKKKFELPYAPLLAAGVKFYATLGNHDEANERFYKPFNMGEKRYYSFKNGNVQFFALDSTYMDGTQIEWLKTQLSESNADWKVCFFHHPFYSDGKFHGPDLDLRARLEPIFEKYNVNVVFTGHEHFYERLKPQNGIYYFIEGSSGELRMHNVKQSPTVGKAFDTDRAFMIVEAAGNDMYFETISRTGEIVDSGKLERQPASVTASVWTH
ncbi:MAG TPA: metallophosphoesterase [Bryobacteraceae bacterium]|jgi:predicted phosphodiesterase|nr:metallophosphoesterase [Bryobacteraceae bacterium]